MQTNQEHQEHEASTAPRRGSVKRLVFLLFNIYPKMAHYLGSENPGPDSGAFIEDLHNIGVQEDSIVLMRRIFAVLHRAGHNLDATTKLNQYILGAVSVLNLILLSALVSVGRTDLPLSIAWIAWIVSLVCTAGGLFLSAKQGKIKNLKFPLIYSIIVNFSFFGGGISMTALIWHFWNIAGWLFALLASMMYILCMFYEVITRIREAIQEQEKQ